MPEKDMKTDLLKIHQYVQTWRALLRQGKGLNLEESFSIIEEIVEENLGDIDGEKGQD